MCGKGEYRKFDAEDAGRRLTERRLFVKSDLLYGVCSRASLNFLHIHFGTSGAHFLSTSASQPCNFSDLARRHVKTTFLDGYLAALHCPGSVHARNSAKGYCRSIVAFHRRIRKIRREGFMREISFWFPFSTTPKREPTLKDTSK